MTLRFLHQSSPISVFLASQKKRNKSLLYRQKNALDRTFPPNRLMHQLLVQIFVFEFGCCPVRITIKQSKRNIKKKLYSNAIVVMISRHIDYRPLFSISCSEAMQRYCNIALETPNSREIKALITETIMIVVAQ